MPIYININQYMAMILNELFKISYIDIPIRNKGKYPKSLSEFENLENWMNYLINQEIIDKKFVKKIV
jgi:hypothetical protein